MFEVLFTNCDQDMPRRQTFTVCDCFQDVIDSDLRCGVGNFVDPVNKENRVTCTCELPQKCRQVVGYPQDVGVRWPPPGMNATVLQDEDGTSAGAFLGYFLQEG